MTVSETTGTGFSSSRRVMYGRIVNANGSLVFLRRELLWGIHPSVERIYSGGQFECSEFVIDVFLISTDVRQVLPQEEEARVEVARKGRQRQEMYSSSRLKRGG
jgi:hypothetical protein